MKSSNKYLIIFITFIIIIIVFLFFIKKDEKTKDFEQIKDIEQEQADADQEIDKCANVAGKDEKNQCITLLAIESRDEEICKAIKNNEHSQFCKQRVDFEKIIDSNNIAACDNIDSAHLMKSCVSIIAANKEYSEEDCRSLEDSQREICLSYIFLKKAIESNDASFCDKLEENKKK